MARRVALIALAAVGLAVALVVLLDPGDARARRVSFSLIYTVTPQQSPARVILTTVIPQTLTGKQKIEQISYSHTPAKEFSGRGNRYARFILDDVREPIDVTIQVEADLYRHDLAARAGQPVEPELFENSDWLLHEKFVEADSFQVQEAARQIDGKDELDAIRQIQACVQERLRYTGYNGKDFGASEALKQGHGDCNEFADLFVALCRAKGIRARTWEGYTTNPPRQGDTAKHDWAEVYTEAHGWIPVDPLYIALGSATMEKVGSYYIYLSCVRNDRVLDQFHYFAYTAETGQVQVEDRFVIHRQQALRR